MIIKRIKIFLLIFLFCTVHSNSYSDDIYIDPEPYATDSTHNNKYYEGLNIIVVTANDYATKIGYEILQNGGTVFDAAISIQIALGLVEPQSSGLGGGLFITFFDNNSKKVMTYEGRETAPKNINQNLFLDENQKPKKFFSAVVGGLSVGTPATLKALYELNRDYGTIEWKYLLQPVISLAREGFIPPKRLVSALKKEKYLFEVEPNSKFKEILNNPNEKFFNLDYANTLEKISENIEDFYNGQIASNIVEKIKSSQNPGFMTKRDLSDYKVQKKSALCHKLKNEFKVCGPSLPSSGTICVLQALKLYESLLRENKIVGSKEKFRLKLSILNFVYYLRDKYLGDDNFDIVDIDKLLNTSFLLKEFNLFKKLKLNAVNNNIDEILNSTSHFTLVDKYQNVISLTSSIESSFGSRLFTDGFFLNNQLTDFRFKTTDANGKVLKNIPQGNKKPLSSMSPLIIFDKNDNFYMTVGSPGGKAIISYVFRVISEDFFSDYKIRDIVEKPNFIKINGKNFFEKKILNEISSESGKIRNLTSGLAIIKKKNDFYIGVADSRRDGTVKGK
jgi:gamma-glutamyltranspeptidase/glutathione hydrolase